MGRIIRVPLIRVVFFLLFRFTATIFRIFVLTALLWTKRLQSIPDTYGIYLIIFCWLPAECLTHCFNVTTFSCFLTRDAMIVFIYCLIDE